MLKNFTQSSITKKFDMQKFHTTKCNQKISFSKILHTQMQPKKNSYKKNNPSANPCSALLNFI
jgi:hypothetical protein